MTRTHDRGLILSGLMGSGKSSLERVLVQKYGYRQPTNVVTRAVNLDEDPNYKTMAEPQFIELARDGSLVFAYRFGQTWYAYPRSDWLAILREGGRGWVMNVRPYVGLLLRSFLDAADAVWLEVDEDTRISRVHQRGAPKDVDPNRARQDDLERLYRNLYTNIVDSTNLDDCVERTLRIARNAVPSP